MGGVEGRGADERWWCGSDIHGPLLVFFLFPFSSFAVPASYCLVPCSSLAVCADFGHIYRRSLVSVCPKVNNMSRSASLAPASGGSRCVSFLLFFVPRLLSHVQRVWHFGPILFIWPYWAAACCILYLLASRLNRVTACLLSCIKARYCQESSSSSCAFSSWTDRMPALFLGFDYAARSV